MFCVNCGSRLEENAQFCIFCGKPVSKNGSQEIAVQKSAGGQIAASQPEVLRKLSHRLIASMALWAVAVALWMIMMKGSFSSWNMIGKVSGIIELIILVGIVFTRFDESKNVYTNIFCFLTLRLLHFQFSVLPAVFAPSALISVSPLHESLRRY